MAGRIRIKPVQDALDAAGPGSVIVLPSGLYRKTLVLKGRAGTPDNPIRIVGMGRGWLRRGLEGDFTWRVGRDGYAAGDEPPHRGSPPKPDLQDEALLQLVKCRHVVIDGLSVRDCWPTILLIRDSDHIVIRNCRLEGGTYAIFAKGAQTSRLLIEKNRWRQDTSRNHRLWHGIDWVEAHGGEGGNGTARHFNGGFLAGKGIAGSIVLRDNRITDAYNGIRLKCDYADRIGETGAYLNAGVHIYRNVFVRIRDNPIEPEGFAYDWHVRHNHLEDCHSWFSFDSLRGGYWYFYGNTGGFRTRQGLAADGTGDPGRHHTIGRVLKLSYQSRVTHCGVPDGGMDGTPEFPWYVIHNSWRLRCPIVGGANATLPPDGEGPDFTAEMTFANNAFDWPPAPTGNPWLSTPMMPLRNLSFAMSRALLFDGNLWTGWGSYDYAAGLPAGGGWERHGVRSERPLFTRGTFVLKAGSPGLGSAVPLYVATPSGKVTLRADSDGTLHRGAVQAYGLVSIPDLEAQGEALARTIDPTAVLPSA